ncbi:MAG: carbon-nitrogen hydrolase family protein [Candidatus Omnitrophota bacterium]|jgi:predicted amidohydrolase
MRVAVIQIRAQSQKSYNLKKAIDFLGEAAGNKAELIALPEVFNYRGFLNTNDLRERVFESIPGFSTLPLMDFAKKHRVSILGGSIYERSGYLDKAYNTSIAINQRGEIIAKYRKRHLFDAKVGSKIVKETQTFLPGTKRKHFQIDQLRFGMSLCFDLRFPEHYRKYSQRGCHVLCVPSAFTHTTGQHHWEPLLRARSIENLSYIVAPNQAGRDEQGIVCFGHSMIISPWGEILAEASAHKEEIIYAELDLKTVMKIRTRFSGIY